MNGCETVMNVYRIGFLVNPIAGMGGRVGLKGTDGHAYRLALARGAQPESPQRALQFLNEVNAEGFQIIAAPGIMGADVVFKSKHKERLAEIVGEIGVVTTADDTRRIARLMLGRRINLLVFVGGDGTARDVLDAIDQAVPVIGVPSGVKMYSSVFAVNPRAAAGLLEAFLRGEAVIVEREVLDIDEEAFRRDELAIRLYGYLKTVFHQEMTQGGKTLFSGIHEEENKEAIARYVVENMSRDTVYVLGPGSTVKAIAKALGVEYTLLGVDVVLNGRLLYKDAWEAHLLKLLQDYGNVKVIVTPIGGQGFIFGRGNQQLSPKFLSRIDKKDIIIVSTESKIRSLECLRVDTGDPAVDQRLRGYYRVIVDYNRYLVMKVV
ncbi:MAG: ATP-NAD kinase family protein [Thermosphaera aggregans]